MPDPRRTLTITFRAGDAHPLDARIDALASELRGLVDVRRRDRLRACRGHHRSAAFKAAVSAKLRGHPVSAATKATWLYAVGVDLPVLVWGRCGKRLRPDEGFHSKEERRRSIRTGVCQRLSKRQRSETPLPFRDLLLSIASTAYGMRDRLRPGLSGPDDRLQPGI